MLTSARAAERRTLPVRGAGGFTLLELMVVMAVLAMLFGMGTGLFSSLSVGARGAMGMMRTLLRAAREQAVTTQLPARLELDAVRGRAMGYHFLDIGQWHFESPLEKGWTADPQGSPPTNAGPFWGFDSGAGIEVQASGVRAEPSGGAPGGYAALESGGRLVMPLAGRRAFQTDDGFGVALSARLAEGASGRLALRPRTFELALTRRGGLTGRVFLASRSEEDEQGRSASRAAGDLSLKSGPGVVVPGRWTRLELDFDGRVARLLVDGRVVAREILSAPARLAVNDGSDLLIGEGMSQAWDLDDLTLRRIASIGPVELPEGLAFSELRGDATSATEISIHFASDGSLDPLLHRRPVRVALFEDEGEGRGRKRTFVIGLLGAVQEVVE
ncbi:MAG: prepilin-type N-terminal cleavage/methylation domain-containing protein [Planctomycetes bacterium]|nr:prepilin-type N-terminal cleavage/methylation domain-containing protein [Planctomycetota bacterium]